MNRRLRNSAGLQNRKRSLNGFCRFGRDLCNSARMKMRRPRCALHGHAQSRPEISIYALGEALSPLDHAPDALDSRLGRVAGFFLVCVVSFLLRVICGK